MKRDLIGRDAFLTADYEAQFQLLKDPRISLDVQAWMGAEAFQQLAQSRPDSDHLGGGSKNVVFVPGVMGSTLHSEGLGGVWWLDMLRARDKLDQLQLTTDGENDIDPDAVIMPGTVDISYAPFRKALASSMSFGGSVHFPYDWRRSPLWSANALRQVIVKTYQAYGKPVHLVGHSMGGLMIRAALMKYGDDIWSKIGRIVFIGTPHYGSPSIAGYLKNHLWGNVELAVLSMFLSRKTFRSLRGVLSLLPAPAHVYPGAKNDQHPCANFNLYDATAWKLDLDAGETAHLQNVLDEVSRFHSELHEWHDSLLQDYKDRMLIIAGVGQETLFRLEFNPKFWGMWQHTEKITARMQCEENREGDGRVPMASAQLKGVTIRYVKGVHGGLPNIPAVGQEVLAWLLERPLKLPQTCQGALSGHLSAEDETSLSPLLDGSTKLRFRELPDYDNPTPALRAEVEARLDAGDMPQMNFVKLM